MLSLDTDPERMRPPSSSWRLDLLNLRASPDLKTPAASPSRRRPLTPENLRRKPFAAGFLGDPEQVFTSHSQECFLPNPKKVRVCIPVFLSAAHRGVLLASLPPSPARPPLVWDRASASPNLKEIF